MKLSISDTCILKGKKYLLLGLKFNDLFWLGSFGTDQEILLGDYPPRIYATFIFQRKQLLLKELIYRKQSDALTSGYYPARLASDGQHNVMEIWDEVEFTGAITLARNIVEGFHNDANSENPIAFKTVLDITLKDGRIVGVEDCSEKYEQMRNATRKDAV